MSGNACFEQSPYLMRSSAARLRSPSGRTAN